MSERSVWREACLNGTNDTFIIVNVLNTAAF